jgi:hypothetical protein
MVACDGIPTISHFEHGSQIERWHRNWKVAPKIERWHQNWNFTLEPRNLLGGPGILC